VATAGDPADLAARRADRRAGSLVTQALGDALGFLVEGHHPTICAKFVSRAFAGAHPPWETRGPFSFGQYSDDTQLARELALSFVEARGWDPACFARRIAALFESGTIVGRGHATAASAARLLQGVPWDRAGEPPPSAGNGAAMRAGPAGLFLPDDDDQRFRVTDEQAMVTHRDPRARAAAVLVADVVADGIVHGSGPRDDGYFARLAHRVERLDPVLATGVLRSPAWLSVPPAVAAAEIAGFAAPPIGAAHAFERWHGISPFATPSVLYAFYAFRMSPNDPAAVLQTAVSVGGDVDTVAAMAGAMVGAAVGLSGLDTRLEAWSRLLNDQGTFRRHDLVALARDLG
jgi:ADP-ribosylglycohydrolase